LLLLFYRHAGFPSVAKFCHEDVLASISVEFCVDGADFLRLSLFLPPNPSLPLLTLVITITWWTHSFIPSIILSFLPSPI